MVGIEKRERLSSQHGNLLREVSLGESVKFGHEELKGMGIPG